MSWQAAGWAKKCRPHSPTHKLALIVAADYASEKAGAIGITVPDGWAVCWAGIDEIAADCGVSPRTVIRLFADLERDDFIRRDRRYARNPRWGQPGQPKTVRTTDAVWFNYARPYVTAPPDEAKRSAKARAGRLGGKVSAARRAAERETARAAQDIAAAAVSEALGGPPDAPPEPPPQVTPCLALGDNVIGPQVTPSFTAKPTVEPPVNRQNLSRVSQVQTARETNAEDHSMSAKTPAAPAAAALALRPHHSQPPSRRPRRPWIDDGTPEPARYRRPPAAGPERTDP